MFHISIEEVWHQLTNITKQNRQEHKTVYGSKYHNEEIHPKVEYLEDVTSRKCKHKYSSEFGQGDSREYLQKRMDIRSIMRNKNI